MTVRALCASRASRRPGDRLGHLHPWAADQDGQVAPKMAKLPPRWPSLPPRWPPSGHLGPTTLIRSEKALRSPLPCLFAQDGQDGHPFPPPLGAIPAGGCRTEVRTVKANLEPRLWIGGPFSAVCNGPLGVGAVPSIAMEARPCCGVTPPPATAVAVLLLPSISCAAKGLWLLDD